MRIVEPAPAKINLALHVRRRRVDGYHDIETLFAFCRDGDLVTVETADEDKFAIEGPFAEALRTSITPGTSTTPDEENLVIRAAWAFTTSFAIAQSHAITLEKNLPVASGIGGGSADAAATLRALAKLHGIDIEDPRLFAVAVALGADVPACLVGTTALGTGRGDSLEPIIGATGAPVLLVNPGVGVSTAQVFAAWDGVDRGEIGGGDLLARARAGRNDLEPPARTIAPVIGEVRASLDAAPGVVLSRMSGSGATCFALFEDEASRGDAAHKARARGWWCLETALA